MNIFEKAQWITTADFAALSPVNVFHRECEKVRISVPSKLQNYHAVFSSEFTLDSVPSDVRIRIAADDYYKLFINGRFVAMGPAQGYYFAYYYNDVSISDYLRAGINNIEVQVYYHGLVCRAYQSADCRMGLVAEVFSGNSILHATDDSWLVFRDNRYKTDGTIGYDTLFSENFSYKAKNAAPVRASIKETDYTFCKTPAKTVSVYNRFPSEVRTLPKGGAFIDFGQEITGTLSFSFIAPKGGKVKIYMGEETADNSVGVRWDMRCNCKCSETVTLAKDSGVYNQFDYRGFRYAAVIPSGGVEVRNVHAVVRHYPFDEGHCVLETENAMLRKIWEICKNSVKYGSQEVFVDCPTREKGQYSGDATITGSAHCILTGDASLLKKTIENKIQSAFIDDGLMAVMPGSQMQEIADYSLQLPMHLLRYYKTSGDSGFLSQSLSATEKMLAHFGRYARPDGLLENVTDKWNLVDWPENLRDGYMFTSSGKGEKNEGCHAVLNAFYIGAKMNLNEIKAVLGLQQDDISSLIDAFNTEFFDIEKGLYLDCRGSSHYSLHSNALPLFFGINPAGTDEIICDFIMKKRLCCGVYFAFFVLKALCRAGRHKDALALILDENSWSKMVSQGATTCFEAWGKEDKWNTSLCHPWASAPIIILAEDILPAMPEVGKIITG